MGNFEEAFLEQIKCCHCGKPLEKGTEHIRLCGEYFCSKECTREYFADEMNE